jgi:hypothetical protein
MSERSRLSFNEKRIKGAKIGGTLILSGTSEDLAPARDISHIG